MLKRKLSPPVGERDARETVDLDRNGDFSMPAGFQLSDVPLVDLVRELRERGHDAIPAGCYAAALQEVERFHAAAAARAERERNLVDATPVIRRLEEFASVHYPNAVAEIGELMRKNTDLEIAVDRAERDASILADILVGEEIDDMERGE
jgi:hypothetical protein